MTTRPYAAARRTLSIVDKLYEINWGLVLLITHHRLRRLCDALFGGGRRASRPGRASR